MFKIDSSNIHNKGIISTRNIPYGEIIGPWISNKPFGDVVPRYLKKDEWWEDIPLGRWCNHSSNSNTYLEFKSGRYYLISKDIKKDEEILVNYKWAYNITGYYNPIIDNKIYD